jgi:hypothetical protein
MTDDGALSIANVRESVAAGGGGWQAEETQHWQLPLDQKKLRLGAVPPNTTLAAREELARQKIAAEAPAPGIYPTSHDWRSVGGLDYVTSIKDQSSCGSCVAFGTAATVETTARVKFGASLVIDLSEAELFYCVAKKQGSTCATGWWPDQAFQAFEGPGVSDEAHFPYTAGDQNCGLTWGWQNVVTKLTAWHTLSSTADMKSWLSTRGALSACFTVYEDFYAYSSGIYTYRTGQVVGGHCVSIVGYDDSQHCWICKNSWGSGWGEAGFFRISYGQCGIDAEMWAADSVVVPSAGTVPLYRYWNSNISDHFYTTNWADLGTSKFGYKFEETQCYVFATQQPGSVPLYRYWNNTIGDHFYTTNWAELGAGRSGYTYERIQCYVFASAGQNNVGVYRYYNPSGTDHFYTTNYDELGAGNYGYHLEMTQFFAPAGPGAVAATTALDPVPEGFRVGEVSPSADSLVDAPATFTVNLNASGGAFQQQ